MVFPHCYAVGSPGPVCIYSLEGWLAPADCFVAEQTAEAVTGGGKPPFQTVNTEAVEQAHGV